MTEEKKPRRASNGDIWRAKEMLGANFSHPPPSPGPRRRILIEKGELVEFRFWSPAVIRTWDNHYLSIPENEFNIKFEYVGRILEDVYRRNQNSTKEILDAKLYTIEGSADE